MSCGHEKAFDTVKHEEIIKILSDIDVYENENRLISNLYWNQKGRKTVCDEKAEWADRKRDVKEVLFVNIRLVLTVYPSSRG